MNRTSSARALPSKAAEGRRTPRRWRVGRGHPNFRQELKTEHGKKCCASDNACEARNSEIGQSLASLMNESSFEAKSNMTRIPKVLLAVSLAAFAVGIVAAFGNPGIPVGWTVMIPLGAVCCGLFLVTFLLQKEVSRFDEEELARLALAEGDGAGHANEAASTVSSTATNLTPAHSH